MEDPEDKLGMNFKFWESYYFNIWYILRLATLNWLTKGGA